MSGFVTFIPHYLVWHYTRAIKDFFKVFRNFIWFFYHFFSIPVLARTLFSPFRRMGEQYKEGLDIEAFFETFVVNTLMRIVGVVARIFVIGAGIVTIVLAVVLGIALFGVWILLPAFVPTLFLMGITGINI
ncbi:MAG: hypothetical protein KAR00_02805 [Candidatus Pacebacteria bacterium]|nr:hypothetical protein [Candidatus Paceibacterota bacterium]